jgi:hypothetical protein
VDKRAYWEECILILEAYGMERRQAGRMIIVFQLLLQKLGRWD